MIIQGKRIQWGNNKNQNPIFRALYVRNPAPVFMKVPLNAMHKARQAGKELFLVQ